MLILKKSNDIILTISAACGDPGPFTNGTKTGGTEYGDTLTYSCDVGFTLVGTSVMTCTTSGWDSDPPVCYSESQNISFMMNMAYDDSRHIYSVETI